LGEPNDDRYAPKGPKRITAARTDYVGSLGHILGGWHDNPRIPVFPDPPYATNTSQNRFNNAQGGGTPWVSNQWSQDQRNCNGVFRYDGQWKLSDITDGTSSTIAIFEDYHMRMGDANNPKREIIKDINEDGAWVISEAATGSLRSPLKNRNPAWFGDGWDFDPRAHGWDSGHPGGGNACRADGSVQFYNENMTHIVRYSLATKAGNDNER